MLKAHARAVRKIEALTLYSLIVGLGYPKGDAAEAAARRAGISRATLRRAVDATFGEPEQDHYFLLLPQWRGRIRRAPFSLRARAVIKADVTHRGRRRRLPRGYFNQIRRWARRHALQVPSDRTMQRYIANEVGRLRSTNAARRLKVLRGGRIN